jgi:hypothetical protein
MSFVFGTDAFRFSKDLGQCQDTDYKRAFKG